MIKSSRARVWIGIAIAITGVVGAFIWVGFQFWALDGDVSDFQRATEESPLEFELTESVLWTLFVEPDSFSLNGVRFAVFDLDTGSEVTLQPYGGSFSYDVFSHSGRSVATAQLDAGRYRLVVDGPVTIAIGPSPASRVAWMVGGGFAIGAPLFLIGVVMAITGAVRDSRRRNQQGTPPPSPWSAGEWPQEPGQ